jgi:pimeloyl-ACP methyl ester carboxylesterase
VNLLLLPGLLCDGALWSPILPYVERRAECRVAGYTSATSLPAMAERVLADAPSTFALAGHSMGGRVALEVLRQAPTRVSKLALLDTGFRPRAEGPAGEDERARRLALLVLARTRGMRAMAREWVRPMVHPDRLDDTPLIDSVLDMFERRTADEFAGQIEALLARPDATTLLRSIACPTLVLCGRDDGWSKLEQHEEMAALIPGATLIVIDRCGHMAPMEQPAEVGPALARWLAESVRDSATDSRMLPLQRA